MEQTESSDDMDEDAPPLPPKGDRPLINFAIHGTWQPVSQASQAQQVEPQLVNN